MDKKYELVNFCEFDKYAIKSYCAIHGVDESLNLGDITKVDETKLKPFNMIVGGSPCQDFSVAGKQQGSRWTCKNKDCKHEYNPLTVHYSERHKCPKCGSEELDKSRSSLLVEWLRIIKGNKPNFGIYENVKNIVGKEFKETTFKLFEEELHEYGYNTYWQIMNGKNYGVPQNRERVFLVLIKKELDNNLFKFPEGFPLELKLKDILEPLVDNKYYINSEAGNKLLQTLEEKGWDKQKSLQKIGNIYPSNGENGNIYMTDGISPTLKSGQGVVGNGIGSNNSPKIVQIEDKPVRLGGLFDDDKSIHQAGSIWDKDCISPTVDTCQGGV